MPEFTFNATALGAGGVIRHRNVETIIPSIGSVALAPIGGTGRAVVENYYSEALSFRFAETRVSGGRVEGKNTTQTYVYMKDLRVFNSLRIGELRGIVTSTQAADPNDDDNSIIMDVFYHDVWIADAEVEPNVDETMKSLRCYGDLDAVIGASTGPGLVSLQPHVVLPDDPQEIVSRFCTVPHPPRPENVDPNGCTATLEELKSRVKERRALRGTLVKHVENGTPAGHACDVAVPGLGKVRFGELMFKPGRRRVNLLRVALGNDTFDDVLDANETPVGASGGSLVFASVEGNGTTVYP